MSASTDEARPEWLPEEYDPDGSLRKRLRIMGDLGTDIQLHVEGEKGVVENVGAPVELTERGDGVLVLKCGMAIDDWEYEVVVPKPEHGDPVLKSVDPNQDIEAYMETQKTIQRDVDVRIFGVDAGRFDHEFSRGEL